MLYSADEVAEKLKVSKVTVYAKLKKFDELVVLKQGKKYVTEELFNLIKNDLKIKDTDNNNLNTDDNKNMPNDEIATDREELFNLNQDLINALLEQLREKDKQIAELHKLIENNQILLKQEKQLDQLQLEEHLRELDLKLDSVKEKMEERKIDKKKGFFKKFF